MRGQLLDGNHYILGQVVMVVEPIIAPIGVPVTRKIKCHQWHPEGESNGVPCVRILCPTVYEHNARIGITPHQGTQVPAIWTPNTHTFDERSGTRVNAIFGNVFGEQTELVIIILHLLRYGSVVVVAPNVVVELDGTVVRGTSVVETTVVETTVVGTTVVGTTDVVVE